MKEVFLMFSYVAKCSNGCYEYKRRVFVDRRLSSFPSGQVGVLIKGNLIQLVSYETIVAEIDNNWLHIYTLYSQTTQKHIKAFLREYVPGLSYHGAKSLFDAGEEMNIETGEVRKASLGMIQTVGVKV